MIGIFVESIIYRYRSNRSAVVNTMENQFIVKRGKRWYDFYIKGVNFPSGESGNFSGAAALSKAEYKKWFKEIAAMNANVIRVYSIQPPAFYRAFLEYNLLATKPIHLLHGIRTDSGRRYFHAYEDRFNSDFLEEIRHTIDVVHGKAASRQSSGAYTHNISPYVIGYILDGWKDADFILATDERNTNIFGFEGDYLYTVNASPYESWLAAMGNYVISYEHDKYGGPFKIISWINNPVTDPLVRDPGARVTRVDVEHIRPTEKFNAGIFATYHIYPNYHVRPNESNPYAAYLRLLKAHHKMPVIEAEFNGSAYEGEASQMVGVIFSAGFFGGILYAWQDEWLKKSYSTVQEKFAEY